MNTKNFNPPHTRVTHLPKPMTTTDKLNHINAKCDDIIEQIKKLPQSDSERLSLTKEDYAFFHKSRITLPIFTQIIKDQIGYLSMLADVDAKHAKPMQNKIIARWEAVYGEIKEETP